MKCNNLQDESEKAKRQKLSQEEVKKRNQEYEQTKRKRLFKDVWKQNRPWLRIEKKDGKEVMFCDYCIPISSSAHHERNVQKNAFIYGCSNIRLEIIKIHESTNTHLYAVNRKKNQCDPKNAPAHRAQQSLNKAIYAKLSIMFRTVHAINIHARSSTDFIWMNKLDAKKGLEIGEKYSGNPKNCREFAAAIADVQRKKISDKLSRSNFVSVIVDGSTDSAMAENEMIYIQTCSSGSISTNFIYCCQVECGTASGIIDAIQRAVKTICDWPQFIHKLVGLGSDGASVMLGKNNGVIALLQAMQPSVVPVHCLGHKLELAYKDAIKNTALAEKVITMLIGLYYLYRVPLNRTNLKNAFRCLGFKKLYPVWAGGSRWIGHTLHALTNFIDGYKAIHLHLEQLASSGEKSESHTKSIGFLKLIRSRDILAMALFLKDVLTILARVSKKFQEEGSVVADVSLTIKSTVRALELLSTKDGPFLQKLGEFEKCEYPTAGSNTRRTYKLMGSDGQISSSREKLIKLLCEKLKTHFEDTVEKIVSATSVANFKQWPLNEKALEDYGDTMIKDLIDHYENVLDNADEARAEWPMLKIGIMEIFSKALDSLTWEQVNRRFGREYPIF